MAYRIEYEPGSKFDMQTTPVSKWKAMTAAFLVLFLLLTGLLWTEGRDMLRRILIPGDPEVTADAFSSMLEELRDGEPVVDAVTAFCQEILDNA